MPLIIPANTLSAGGYDVANSCRFNRADSPYMHITPGGDGNLKIFTVSFWVKRVSVNGGTSGTDREVIFSNATNDQFSFHNDKFEFLENGSTSASTNMLFRDFSGWYHIVAAFDTSQATNTNRNKYYVNGKQIDQSTGFSTMSYVGQDLEMGFGKGSEMMSVGRSEFDDNRHFNGYLAEFYYINGTMLDHTSFGENDSDSPTIWKPKKFTGSYGTNGFYLDFEASANLGNDANGGTDLTEVNLAAADQMLDTPTNNFCTVNPLDQAVGTFDISEGNLKYERTSDTTDWKSARGTIGIPNAGKWYWEMAKVGGSVDGGFGGIATDVADLTQEVTGFWGFHDGGGGSNYTIHNGSYTDVGSSYNVSDYDIIQIAFDRDNNKLWVGLNNTWGVNGGTPVTPSDPASGFLSISTNVLPAFMIRGSFQCVANFGQDSSFAGNVTRQSNSDGNGYGDFYYTPPSGYLALCTKNVGSDGG